MRHRDSVQVRAARCTHAVFGSAAMLVTAVTALAAQSSTDTVVVEAGAHYRAGGLHRALFGTDYRSLWTLPLAVQTLDLANFAGGLTPLSGRRGGFQTVSLWFRGEDGYRYGVRSVDKDPAVLPPEFEGTFIEDLLKDQTSAQYPFAPAVVAGLAEAVGIPHTEPTLVVIPDDPLLDTFRLGFANTLGYFERHAIVEPGRPGFLGAIEIIDSDHFFPLSAQGPANQADTRELLRARLFDVWIGDWDRHPRQFTFARFSETPPHIWLALPEDRDQAFSKYDGLMLALARLAMPFLLNFGPKYASPVGVGWNGRELDRRFLTYLPDATWDTVAAELVAAASDSAIDAAVRRMPPEAYPLEGARLAETLKIRRDRLAAYEPRFRAVLLEEAELHATDASEAVSISRYADGRVTVTIAEDTPGSRPYVERTFDPSLTRELRVYLHGGDDRVTVLGPGERITVRIVGGGSATLTDSSTGSAVRFYASGDDVATGPGRTHVDRRADVGPAPDRPYRYYRDWGSTWDPTGWLAFGPDVGLFVGPGVSLKDFGFRKYPFATRVRLRAGWAFQAMTGRADLDLEAHGENSRIRTILYARASGIEVVRYNGPGNETTLGADEEFYRVRQQQYLLIPAVVLPVAAHLEFSLGPSIEFIKTRTGDGRIVDVTSPYGSDEWAQLGGRARLQWDSRDSERYPTRGLYARVDGAAFPPWLDVDSTYGFVDGSVSGYLTGTGLPLHPTLALRAGGRQVWGTYPFFSSAFIGDAASVRLGHQSRYAGDASLYGNAELRLRLTDFFVILPGEIGVFGLADAGRVFLSSETSDRWHTALGGGVWLSLLQYTTLLHVAIAVSDERTAFYFGTGMAF
jgi:hypothetical protein